ncbi:MAG: serine/threonine-protein kinase, partial [Polyangiaceae bacterium]
MPDDPSDRGDVPRTGDLIAEKYIVERVLGMGGMGLVLAAKHTTLRQPVAIKLLLSEALASEEARRRFVREARAAGGIKSEHVARVRDFGTLESGAPYLVMEYLDGVDLKQRLAEHGPLPISDAVDYVLQASEALCEAHNAGIVHRDLKPANLFLTAHADGSALIKVLDFGISKAACFDSVGHNADLTRTDAVLGSPVYMSPEQVRSPRDVDLRTDIWGIGAVLFELLAGMPPFDADNVAMLGARIVMDPPRSLREARPDVPAALEAVVLKCLEKVPANRYRSIADFAHALGEFAPEGAQLSLQRISRIGSRA